MIGHKTRAVVERNNVVAEEDLRDAVQRIEGARLHQKTVKASKEDLERLKNPLRKCGEGLSFQIAGLDLNQRSSGYEAGVALFEVLERGQAGHWPPQPFLRREAPRCEELVVGYDSLEV